VPKYPVDLSEQPTGQSKTTDDTRERKTPGVVNDIEAEMYTGCKASPKACAVARPSWSMHRRYTFPGMKDDGFALRFHTLLSVVAVNS
jgi:hypothetical protein